MQYKFNPQKSGWSKTDSNGNPGLSIFEHCCHVGWVALELVNQGRNIPHPEIKHQDAGLIAACHDVGKWGPGFLYMCPAWLEREGLTIFAERNAWKAQTGCRHEKCSQDSIQLLLMDRGFKSSEAVAWAMISGAHHGKMHVGVNYRSKDVQYQLTDVWHEQRIQMVEALELEFDNKLPSFGLEKGHAVIPWLMGLTSVADWIGSNEDYFPVEKGLGKKEAQRSAKNAVKRIGLGKPKMKHHISFGEIFGFDANDMQKKALSVITEPGIYIIEAPMGLGKTEAALGCAYGLLQCGLASGLYFALPTQLTSNRIHLRVNEFVKKITNDSENTRLAHANAWLEKEYYQPPSSEKFKGASDADVSPVRDWFASAKRALLANFGVGTIDQALMAVVAVKHFFVRRFALAGKVVIIDEVHSYDHFTGTLVNCLCRELQQLGCTIIILSATLLPGVRNKLLDVQDKEIQSDGYPLITGKTNAGKVILSIKSKPDPRPAVRRIFKSEEKIFTDALVAARQGARVLWVCNTVNNAQNVFQQLEKQKDGFELGLLHSRFPHFLRQQQESYWMNRLGKMDVSIEGCILVSTQIVEQSVDIDSDILISELAPMDMLLQRMGRLWRHLEDRPPTKRSVKYPEIWLKDEGKSLAELQSISADGLTKFLGTKARVYQPYVLLKTYEALHGFDSISLVDEKGNSDIRELLQLTYLNDQSDSESWSALAQDMMGTEFAEQQLARSNTRLFSKAALDDEEGKQTRLIEIPTIPMIIATRILQDKMVLLNGDEIVLKPEKFDIQHARSIHRNIIRVHAWPHETPVIHLAISFYIKGDHCLALLNENNDLEIGGLKEGVSIEWDETIGVKQTYFKGDRDESCDGSLAACNR